MCNVCCRMSNTSALMDLLFAGARQRVLAVLLSSLIPASMYANWRS